MAGVRNCSANPQHQGVTCITFRKGRHGAGRQERGTFQAVAVPVAGPGEQTRSTPRLAEREVELLKGFAVRRLLADGRQAAVVTIQLDLSMECVAGPLSR